MTRFCVENSIVKELKEQNLNAANLLQECYKAKKRKKQRELIEDAIIIYRLSRTPARRVFYINVGNLSNHRAMAYLEKIKNEIRQ